MAETVTQQAARDRFEERLSDFAHAGCDLFEARLLGKGGESEAKARLESAYLAVLGAFNAACEEARRG